jgi:methyltransferase (TIGR00027 family)
MIKTPHNIIRTGVPSRTALRVAEVRAVHALLDEPLVLDDPIALPILGPKTKAQLLDDPFQFNDPISRGLRAALVARCRVAEDELAHAVARGVRQYVILGAGLDTFAYRNPHRATGLRVFEVDHLSTQQWKRQLLGNANIGVPSDVAFAAVDFENGTLTEGLAAAGYAANEPACVSWLGVTMYLSEEAVFGTLQHFVGLPIGSSITFDYRVPPETLHPIARAIDHFIAHRAAEAGEPWVAVFEPDRLRDKLLKLGFGAVETFGPDELNRRYFHRRKDGLRTSSHIVIARN